MTLRNTGLRSSAIALASCLVLSGMPLATHAAGLGKLVVLSPLGQPLRAEIEVSATREELSDMKAQLASPESFKQAGVDYATSLLSIHFNLDKRPNGQSVVRLTSDRPINDPFMDMLLELNWPTGRLVREYTFLLDPPEVATKAQAPVASATAKPTGSKAPVAVKPAATAIDDESRAKAIAQTGSQSEAKPVDQPPAGGTTDAHLVKNGETLRKIANETKPDGVSLEQMLVGLLRANQDAFDGGNMNRLKSGKILSVPEKSTLESIPLAEAKKIVMTQSSDWNAYRSKLAGVAAQSPVKEEAAKQEASGKITAKVEDKAAPAEEPKDQLKVSKTETATKKAEAAAKRSEEDLIAKDKALKEAVERQAILEKNVADLQKLLELKNQNLAELQKQAAAKQAPAEAKKAAEEPKPAAPSPSPAPTAPAKVEAPAPAAAEAPASAPAPVAEKPAEKPVDVKAPDEPAKPEAAAPAPEPTPAPAPKPVDKPKPAVVPPPPPPEEPSFFADLLDNPLLPVVGGGGILALVAAYLVSRRRRVAKREEPLDLSGSLTPQSSMTGNSVFRNTGGQSVDTSHGPAHTDFSQAGPGSIDTDEVDPVAEADVYMAYGRDAQAEEILVEAKSKDPKRYAIHLKLLEIYANRKDLKQFESLATDLYSETGGIGAEWEKAAAMGSKLDPGNPLFGTPEALPPAAPVSITPASFNADSTVIVSSTALKNTVTLPGELSKLANSVKAPEPAPARVEVPSPTPSPVAAPVAAAPAAPELTSLDFDLGLNTDPAFVDLSEKAEPEDVKQPAESLTDSGSLDFDLAAGDQPVSFAPAAAKPAAQPIEPPQFAQADATLVLPEAVAEKQLSGLDFDLGLDTHEPTVVIPVPALEPLPTTLAPEPAHVDSDGVEFDVSLTESTFLGRSLPQSTSFDMYAIDLDLNQPELPAGQAKEPAVSEPVKAAAPVAEVPPAAENEAFDTLASTAVNPDFGIAQAETVVNPQFGADQDMLPEFDISENEEVATKLDLAKAYEEMGDLEGARELLNEVLKEGDGAQKEKAKAILAKLGA